MKIFLVEKFAEFGDQLTVAAFEFVPDFPGGCQITEWFGQWQQNFGLDQGRIVVSARCHTQQLAGHLAGHRGEEKDYRYRHQVGNAESFHPGAEKLFTPADVDQGDHEGHQKHHHGTHDDRKNQVKFFLRMHGSLS
jgi:hypothetical protein